MRKKIASWFGRQEHDFAESLGLWLVIVNIGYYHFINWWWNISLILWILYYISHRLEKKFYGKNGYRGFN